VRLLVAQSGRRANSVKNFQDMLEPGTGNVH
jgi:hypothetical protein